MTQSILRVCSGLLLLIAATGCATVKNITISTKPADAMIKVNGVDIGRGPIRQQFTFQDESSISRVTASRLGFRDTNYNLRRDYDRETLLIELKPAPKRFSVQVAPVQAMISINGRAVSSEMTSFVTPEIEFPLDAKGNFVPAVITAERSGFVSASATVNYTDVSSTVTLNLEPLRKDLSITSNPPGAQVFLDDEPLGATPVKDSARAFPIDPSTNKFIPRKLKLVKAGYDPTLVDIAWDDGKTEYSIDLLAKAKTVRIATDPPGTKVLIEGQELKPDASGAITTKLTFLPVNDQGELRVFKGTALKKTADQEWYPLEFTVGWDNGKSDYTLKLREIKIAPLPLLTVALTRNDTGWEPQPRTITTIAGKQTNDEGDAPLPTRITRDLAKGTMIDTFAVAPDGKSLLYTVLNASDKADFRSQLFRIRTDGSGGTDIVTDGKSLDLTPSFSPSGDLIVFSSNRAGKRLAVWSKSSSGGPGVTSLTTGETNDLWPSVDSDPKPRLFYQSLIDTRSEPRLFSSPLGAALRTDLATLGGMQPRISPRNDAILFTAVNEKSGKRDVYRMSDKGGAPENLTNSADADDFDPTWNKDGSKIAFASDRGTDDEGRKQVDIYVLDLNKSDEPVRVTSNPGVDDNPAFDPLAKAIYFRSNRGSEWGIWKVALP